MDYGIKSIDGKMFQAIDEKIVIDGESNSVKDINNDEQVKIWSGTEAEYLALPYGSNDTIFYVDKGNENIKLYRGRYFTPLDVPNLDRWLPRPSNSSLKRIDGDNTYITAWIDNSGFNHSVTQSVEASQPKLVDDWVVFDGSDDFLSSDFVNAVSGLDQNYTIIAKVKISTPSTFTHIAGEYATGNDNASYELIRTGTDLNQMASQVKADNGGVTKAFDSGEGVAFDGTEHTICILFDEINDRVKGYVDGVKTRDVGLYSPETDYLTLTNFVIGCATHSSNEGFLDGQIKELITVKRALTDQEVIDVTNWMDRV